MDKKQQVELKRRVAAAIKRDTYPDRAWEVLVAQGHVADYEEGRISDVVLIDYAKALSLYADLVEYAETPPSPKAGDRVAEPLPSDGYEAQRAKTLAAFLELKVAGNPGVIAWRKLAWGTQKPASSESAYNLAESSEVRDIYSGRQASQDLMIEPSGVLDCFGRKPGHVHRVEFYKGSILERLRDVSEALRTELFEPWSQAEAAWVAVTGEVREVPRSLVGEIKGFSNQHLTYAKITMEIEPWIASDTVVQNYQYLQALVLGRRPRAISDKNLTMARFVMQRLRNLLAKGLEIDRESKNTSWRQLITSWNRTHEQWSFTDERQFYRECRRIARSVARPYAATPFVSTPGASAKISMPKMGIDKEST